MSQTEQVTLDGELRPLDGFGPAEHYRRFGWWVSDVILPPDEIARVRNLCASIDSAERDGPLPEVLSQFLSWDGVPPRPARLNQFIALQYRAIYDLVTTPRIHEIAAELSGAEGLRLFNTALINKEPGPTSRFSTVGIHCDRAYWRTCSSTEMLTAWVPLQDTTLDMGPIRYYSGSHRWASMPHVRALHESQNFTASEEALMLGRLEEAGLSMKVATGSVRAGQVTFHHCLTLHGSGVNTSDRTRYGISVHLQPSDNRYEPLAPSDKYVLDEFVRRRDGVPDYGDDAFCPVTLPVAAG